MPWFIFALMEFAMLLCGVFCTLMGFRLILVDRPDPLSYERWYRQAGVYCKFIGPFSLLIAVALPVAFGYIPAPRWAGQAMALLMLVCFVVFAAATWRSDPPVRWPRGFWGWLGYLFSGLCFGAVLGGILKMADLDVTTDNPWVFGLFGVGLVLSRLLTVWFTRFKHGLGGPVA